MNRCVSGGARGADTVWAANASRNGHEVVHISFVGHEVSPTIYGRRLILPAEELAGANKALYDANDVLNRRIPAKNSYVLRLLQRNWHIVRESSRLYAIAESMNGDVVNGGTGWGVQMFLDRHECHPCEAYVFCQKDASWYKWDVSNTLGWHLWNPPRPDGIYAAIGTRNLLTPGIAAIRDVFHVSSAAGPL